MFEWLRKRLYKGGYRCDRCGKWTERWRGKALVRHHVLFAPAIGSLPPESMEVICLYCPPCAVEVKAGERGEPT